MYEIRPSLDARNLESKFLVTEGKITIFKHQEHIRVKCSTPGLFDMALKNLGFLGFFKNLKSLNLGF